MAAILVVLSSIAGLALSWYYLRKNWAEIKKKNESETSEWKKRYNYVWTTLWYGYLFAFFVGLTVNNLIIAP
jgi:undecaprenyl pyrophosphate phosphatase UppP